MYQLIYYFLSFWIFLCIWGVKYVVEHAFQSTICHKMAYICRVIKTKKQMQTTIVILLVAILFCAYRAAGNTMLTTKNQAHIYKLLKEINDELKNKQQ